jgi:hypothetical protein
MRKTLLIAVAGLAATALSSAASAQLVDNGNGTVTVNGAGTGGMAILNFDGNANGSPVPGLTGQLTLTFVGVNGNGDYGFTYSLLNTSSIDSRISGFAFNTDPNVVGGATGAGSLFTQLITFNDPGNQIYPNGVGAVDVCLRGGGSGSSCGGGAGGGVDDGASAGTGSFTLDFGSGAAPGSINLDAFHVRYQSLPAPYGSGTGNYVPPPPSVPEPATWAMMLFGFGAAGVAMRRQRGKNLAVAQFA